MTEQVVIVAARRTPIGAFQGALAPATAPQLGAAAIRAAIADAGIDPKHIDELLMGCVLPAGLGQAPARQAALSADVPLSTPCTTLNKVCGSGMKTIMIGADAVRAGSANIVVAGGMESMSNAPYLLPKARSGMRMGHAQVIDHMFLDGLQSPYDGNMMGFFAEATSDKYGFSREAQDEISIASVKRSLEAIENGSFKAEITPVTVTHRRQESVVDTDEEPGRCDLEKIPTMRPAFRRDGGTVTAASSSSISDGAAAVMLMSESRAKELGLSPLARIVAQASHAHEPEWFTTAPPGAIQKAADAAGWKLSDVDLFEINEAFACVLMAALHDLDISYERANVNGGACALGHPIGATGARLVVTLIHALRARGLKRGIASQCIGGGEATALAIEV